MVLSSFFLLFCYFFNLKYLLINPNESVSIYLNLMSLGIKNNMNTRNLLLCFAAIFFTFFVFDNVREKNQENAFPQVTYDVFIDYLENGDVELVYLDGRKIRAVTKSNKGLRTLLPPNGDAKLIDSLLKEKVKIESAPPEEKSFLMSLFLTLLPIILLIGFFIIFFGKKEGGKGGSGPFSFGKSKAKLVPPEEINTKFSDVAGNREAIEEVKEIVDFLKNPNKYWELGANIPHGLLMLGPPGTGKTLLAKAVAGEANVPFYSISGSDFVEMFVGVGASRVRDMFQEARKNAPCIIFIDEIDAMGRSRSGGGAGGGNDEREQTLNQMLVEMDGFSGKDAVIVMAATNRADVLDQALVRPGRFDRQVTVGLPDVKGREAILKVHTRKKNVDASFKPDLIARGTPMFSGADLENLCNEAALTAARKGNKVISMVDFEEAKDKILMGAAKKGHVMKESEKVNTAYHEAGHAIVGWTLNKEEDSHDPVYKVSILPRGRALGVTMYLPEEDKYSLSLIEAYAQISSLYGGRIAEEMTSGKQGVTTGASNDIERATEIAYNMVARWGYSEKLGPLLYGVKDGGSGFSGNNQRPTSEAVKEEIDKEIKEIMELSHKRAADILSLNEDKLEIMKDALIKYETIDKDQIEEIMVSCKFPEPPKDWEDPESPIENDKNDEDGENELIIQS